MSSNYNSGTFPYIIQSDDTIWDLADQYDTTVEDIMAANPGVDPNGIYIGQVINVPGDPPSTWVNEPTDSLQRRPEFERRPPSRRPPYRPYYRPPYYRPHYRPGCPGGRLYTIQPGDNIYRISSRFNVPVNEIVARNQYIDFNYLQVGQVICIPFR